ncbi:DUF2937 family protein [Halopseudomonas salegens]|uniref:DUF2937 family protein n=1 Tax=Halopseudomonas salegens TaxID=1434072 RepID=A0A1H2FH40_9GAMM|nr:DUF2937 family protein [Halopseudomonas salegens]SDU06632.1 Protein of unknown function [Halopseudomonas salegens]
MPLFYSYLRVFVFLGCTLAGIQVPVFVDQYGKSLESHLAESRIALNEFQDDADRFFAGSLENLIAHYRSNADQVFNEGGRSIQSIYDRHLMLQRNVRQFQSNPWSAYSQVLLTPVPDVRQEVWKNYSYAIQLKPAAIAFGLVAGLIFTLGIELLLKLLLKTPGLLNKRLQSNPKP